MAIYKVLELGLIQYRGPFDSGVHGPHGESWPSLTAMLAELPQSGWMVEEYIYGPHESLSPSARTLLGMILVNKASTEAQEKERLITKYTNALERLRCETERLSADDLKAQRNEIAIRFYEQNLESLRLS